MAYAAPHYGEWGSLMSGGSGVVGALASLGTLATNIVSLRQNTVTCFTLYSAYPFPITDFFSGNLTTIEHALLIWRED